MSPVIVWFRQDLRLADNPALAAAARAQRPLICLYVLDDETPGLWKPGGASRWWLHHALTTLDEALKTHGGHLVLRRGAAGTVVRALAHETGATQIFWNRCYEPFAVARDTALKKSLEQDGVETHSFNASLLYEPWEIATRQGKPYRVFTPFWNALRERGAPGKPHLAPRTFHFHSGVTGDALKDWALLPVKPDWAAGFGARPGEAGARDSLRKFLRHISHYKTQRDVPSSDGTSRLSPHLHWGEISPRQVWHAVKTHADAQSDGAQAFLRELGWREFCHHLLFYNPQLPDQPLDARFAHFAWRRADSDFAAWSRGRTGIPIVDGGMRQLWQTGWMHNRVRMIAASLLIKHLGVDWRRGEAWFWDTLVDADLANNAAGWQWVAGCGADAAPFFRIFNPVLQGEKFDPDGAYVRRFVPELAGVPDRFVHRPWDTPENCGGPPRDYPAPIVDLAQGRARALAAFKALKP